MMTFVEGPSNLRPDDKSVRSSKHMATVSDSSDISYNAVQIEGDSNVKLGKAHLSVKHRLCVNLARQIKFFRGGFCALVPFLQDLAETCAIYFDESLKNVVIARA